MFSRTSKILYCLTAATFVVTGCTKQESDLTFVRSARSGLLSSALFIEQVVAREPLPAALAGIQSASVLSGAFGTPSGGTNSSSSSPSSGEDDFIAHATQLVDDILRLLVIDVQEKLNGAENRAETLTEYTRELRQTLERARIDMRSFQTTLEDTRGRESALRKRTRDLENELNDAISAGQSQNASSIVQTLTEAQMGLVEAQTTITAGKQLDQSLGDAITLLEERLQAIEANRDALVKGVYVTDIPGVDELGIIRDADGNLRIKGRSTGGFRMF